MKSNPRLRDKQKVWFVQQTKLLEHHLGIQIPDTLGILIKDPCLLTKLFGSIPRTGFHALGLVFLCISFCIFFFCDFDTTSSNSACSLFCSKYFSTNEGA